MPTNLLRFQLYDDPSRQTYRQLGHDKAVTDLPAHGYGHPIQIDEGEGGNREYVVANISRIKREPNPDRPGEERVVYEVYLARQEEWDQFGEPEVFERMRRGRKIE